MEQEKTELVPALVERAVKGDKAALEELLGSVQDLVFNLALRMLGTVPDAEDATQEILVKVMTRLATFKGQSAFTTWVFRVAANHLQSYRKHLFAQHPLSFEEYGEDIASGREQDMPDLSGGVDRALLEKELKLSCSNVMLQCFEPQDRCIFILGTMFKVDSRVAAEMLEMTPEAYRQRLSRLRKRMAAFLGEYCGLAGGRCACARRVDYAVATHRLDPRHLAFPALEPGAQVLQDCVSAMEEIDDLSRVFAAFPAYRATPAARAFLKEFLRSDPYARVAAMEREELE
ncbi:RNA polymerase sigma factor [Allofournierella sp.]|uniref:RNA polymerase sigma factor n=1 Tax=Allofournierella sp. TaxID=1940256 RepID=UPI003AB28498